MKRILDDTSQSSHVVTARTLLRHVPPIGDESSRQRRLRPLILAATQTPPARRWQPAMVLLFLLCSAAAADAMSGGSMERVAARTRAWFAEQPARSVTSSKVAERVASDGAQPVPVPNPSATNAATASSSLTASAPPPAARKPNVGHGDATAPGRSAAASPPALKLATAPASSAPTNDPGTQLMVEAMQARRAGDTARAERLLAQYRGHFPGGALQEEALALSVEAAVLRHHPGAAQLARAYLAQFPHGRYRQWMEQTLASAPP